MVFHRNHCKLSSDVVNSVADDIIDIATIAADKSKFRNALIKERLKTSNKHSILTAYEINSMTRSLSRSYIDPAELSSALKRINKNIGKQYRLLSNIFEGVK